MHILLHLCLIAIESPFDILMYTVEKMWRNAKLHYVTKINIFNINIGSKLKDLTKKMSHCCNFLCRYNIYLCISSNAYCRGVVFFSWKKITKSHYNLKNERKFKALCIIAYMYMLKYKEYNYIYLEITQHEYVLNIIIKW